MGILSKIFGGKKQKSKAEKTEQDVTLLTLHINARLQPKDRGALYEDPLNELLTQAHAGEVSGGGTLMDNNGGGPLSCDVELDVVKSFEARVVELLEQLPLPKGSELIFDEEDGKTKPLGTLEGLAIFLNGTDLSDEVYKNNPIDPIVDALIELIGDNYAFFSHWVGPTETALYFYGTSFEEMKTATADYIAKCPLCEKCRIEQLC